MANIVQMLSNSLKEGRITEEQLKKNFPSYADKVLATPTPSTEEPEDVLEPATMPVDIPVQDSGSDLSPYSTEPVPGGQQLQEPSNDQLSSVRSSTMGVVDFPRQQQAPAFRFQRPEEASMPEPPAPVAPSAQLPEETNLNILANMQFGMPYAELSDLNKSLIDKRAELKAAKAPLGAQLTESLAEADKQKEEAATEFTSPEMPAPVAPTQPSGLSEIMAGMELKQASLEKQAELQALQDQAQAQELESLRMQREEDEKNRQAAREEQRGLVDKKLQRIDMLTQELGKQTIDPDRYWNNKPTGAKIAAVIGAALTGFAGSDAGLRLITQAIDRDIAAQKEQLQTKKGQIAAEENLLARFRQQGMDDEEAYIAAKSFLIEQAGRKIDEAKLGQADERKLAALDAAKGALLMEKGKVLASFYGKEQQAADLSTATPLFKEVVAKVGSPEERKTAVKELGIYNQYVDNVQNLSKMRDEALSIGLSGAIPFTDKKTKFDTYQARLFPVVKSIVGERMTDADARILLEPFIPDVTDTSSQIKEKFKALNEALKPKLQEQIPTLTSYGIVRLNRQESK